MSELAYEFTVEGMAPELFTVLEFTGEERLNEPYRFDLQLVSESKEIRFEEIVGARCRLTIHPGRLFASLAEPTPQEQAPIFLHGMVTELEAASRIKRKSAPTLFFFRVTMSHPLWRLGLNRQNQVYCGKSIPEIIAEELRSGGLRPDEDFFLTLSPYRGRLAEDHDSNRFPRLSFLTQYGESSLHFLHRLLEREGLYYFFTHREQTNAMQIIDQKSNQPEAQPHRLKYDPDAPFDRGACIQDFQVKLTQVAKRVLLREYNPKRPDSFVDAVHEVFPGGSGDAYVYGENISNEDDAENQARLRAELLLCRRATIRAASTAAFLRPGHTFQMTGLTNYQRMNSGYLVTGITHRGCQARIVETLFGCRPEGLADLDYRNEFTALPAAIQFRPERQTPKTRIAGSLPAHIDHDEISDTGAYKVRLPFDLAQRDAGKASCWCRFMKQYVGTNFGQHYPLRKGTEVMLGFIDGDPDRPYIAGAMENATHASVTNNKDVAASVDANGNVTVFSTIGRKNLLADLPGGALAAGTAAPAAQLAADGVHFTLPAAGGFAGLAGGNSTATGSGSIALGQAHPTGGLKPGSITPAVIQARIQPQANVMSADEHTLRAGTHSEEHAGERHETQVGDRYLKHTGTRHQEETVHQTRLVNTNAQTIINQTNHGISQIITGSGGACPPAATAGASGSGGTTAGFTRPALEAAQMRCRQFFDGKSPLQVMERFREIEPCFNRLTLSQKMAMKEELDALRGTLGAGVAPAQPLSRQFAEIIGRYFPAAEAAAVLAFFAKLGNEAVTAADGRLSLHAADAAAGAFLSFPYSTSGSGEIDYVLQVDDINSQIYASTGINSQIYAAVESIFQLYVSTTYLYFVVTLGMCLQMYTGAIITNMNIGLFQHDFNILLDKSETCTSMLNRKTDQAAFDTMARTIATTICLGAGMARTDLEGSTHFLATIKEVKAAISQLSINARNDKAIALAENLEASRNQVAAVATDTSAAD